VTSSFSIVYERAKLSTSSSYRQTGRNYRHAFANGSKPSGNLDLQLTGLTIAPLQLPQWVIDDSATPLLGLYAIK